MEAESVPPSLSEARRRWAEHRRLHYPAPSDRPDSHPPAPHRYGAPPRERIDTFVRHSRTWTVVSDDGGQTFSSPTVVVEHIASAMAVDPSPGGLGRWYVALTGLLSQRDRTWVFEDFEDAVPADIYVMYSDDRGENWSTPTRVNDNRRNAKHETPMLAVNHGGVVGIAWYDRCNNPTNECYDIYFSASLDGGDAFLPNTRISTETSCQNVPGNVVVERDGGQLNVAERWPTGADYGGLAAAPDGSFHILWSDSRTGVDQLWTRRVRLAPDTVHERNGAGIPDKAPHEAASIGAGLDTPKVHPPDFTHLVAGAGGPGP